VLTELESRAATTARQPARLTRPAIYQPHLPQLLTHLRSGTLAVASRVPAVPCSKGNRR
jgi:hypothetical protein